MTVEITEREREVLYCLALGERNNDIAASLEITDSTVAFHIRSIKGKLGATTRTQAVFLAVQQNVITFDEVDTYDAKR